MRIRGGLPSQFFGQLCGSTEGANRDDHGWSAVAVSHRNRDETTFGKRRPGWIGRHERSNPDCIERRMLNQDSGHNAVFLVLMPLVYKLYQLDFLINAYLSL